jgi:hypothetical protein
MRLVIVLAAAVLSVGVAACGGSAAPRIPDAAGVLVTVETTGGECPDGPCGARYVIHRDGRVARSGTSGEASRQLPPDVIARIASLAAVADWDEVRSKPFTGQCPTAYDGQELSYTFETSVGPVAVRSCGSDLSGLELFTSIDEALFGTVG